MDEAMDYEMLVRRAYNCDRYDKKGADADIFRSLEQEEWAHKEDPNDARQKSRYQKSLSEVRHYMIDAFNQGIKRLGAKTEKIDKILDCLSLTTKANNKDELIKAIKQGHDAFIELKIEMD